MNCKPGDLAVIVKAMCAENIGKIVRLHKLVPQGKFTNGMVADSWTFSGAEVVRFQKTGPGVKYIPDNYLRPLRDSDGTDETLTWAPKHEGVKA